MMKKSIIKAGALIMAGTMALGLTACKKDNKPSTQNMTTYQMADYLARGADAHYATYEDNGDVAVAAYFDALGGDTEGWANCYEYGALIGMANRMYDISSGKDKEYYKKLFDGYVAGLDFYANDSTAYPNYSTITSTHGTNLWNHLYAVKREDSKNMGNITGTLMVYDDLMWIARYFIEAYEYDYSAADKAKYLAEAEYLTKVCLDGWDSTKDGAGGITWGPGYTTKHACSNGPILSVLGGLAEAYKGSDATVTADDTVYVEQTFGFDKVEWKDWVGEKKYDYYLHWLKTVYNWCWDNLRLPNYCFKDLRGHDGVGDSPDPIIEGDYKYNVFPKELNVGDATQYTYNTGSIISGAAWLYRLTGEEGYLTQGRNMSEGAYHRFVKTVKVNGVEHQLYECTSSLLFNSVLLQGYLDLADAIKIQNPANKDTVIKNELNTYVGVFKSSINYAFDNHLLNRTLPQNYIQGWLYGEETKDTKKDVKDAAATPEMLAMIVQYENHHGKI